MSGLLFNTFCLYIPCNQTKLQKQVRTSAFCVSSSSVTTVVVVDSSKTLLTTVSYLSHAFLLSACNVFSGNMTVIRMWPLVSSFHRKCRVRRIRTVTCWCVGVTCSIRWELKEGFVTEKKDDPFCFPDMIDHKSGALKLIGIMLMVFLEWNVPPQSDHSPSAAFYGSMNANDRLMIIWRRLPTADTASAASSALSSVRICHQL